MDTKYIKIPASFGGRSIRDVSEEELEQLKRQLLEAAEILKSGGLVAFPTETVYGLGGDAKNPMAAQKIYAAKGRPSDNPLIVHIARTDQLKGLAAEVPETAEKLIRAFWPGPLTLILRKRQDVPYSTTGGLDTVAVRMPEHPVAWALIDASGIAVAAPSANASGRPSPTRAEHVAEDLSGKIDVILDGGDVGIGIESTIVDVTVKPSVILRPGYITKEMLEAVDGRVDLDPAITEKPAEGVRPKAPGMKYRHYAPRAELTLVAGSRSKVIERICREAKKAQSEGHIVGIIATDETESCYQKKPEWIVKSVGSGKNLPAVARNMFRVLREFDQTNAEVLFAETFPEEELGQAIMNRLKKAAGYRIIQAENEDEV